MNTLTIAITLGLTAVLSFTTLPAKDIDSETTARNTKIQAQCLEQFGQDSWYAYTEADKNSNRYDKYGFKQVSDNKIMIPAEHVITYQYCFDQNKEKAYVAVRENKGWTYIDKDGNDIVQAFNVDAGPDQFFEGISRYVDNNKIGFINEDLEIIIPAKFDGAYTFKNGNAKVCNGCKRETGIEHAPLEGGTWGVVDKEGNVTWE